MKKLNIKKALILCCVIICTLPSCDKFKDSTDYNADEPVKVIAGTWHITKVTRNGLDITKTMDFSKFRINLNEDNTYTIDNYLPFLVRQGGTWSVNDLQYPTKLTFKEGAAAESMSAFDYQTVDGERQITLSFVPGCYSNIYSYILKKESNN
ncbi:DUF5004 domain-containing protein [Dysgonomonas reticulitermitis]